MLIHDVGITGTQPKFGSWAQELGLGNLTSQDPGLGAKVFACRELKFGDSGVFRFLVLA